MAQGPGQKGSQAGPPQDGIWCQGREGGQRSEGGGCPLFPFLDGGPEEPLLPGPRAPSGPRARQGKAGQTQATARVQGNLMTAVFCSRFPSCSGAGGSVGWWGRGGGRGKARREVNRRPQREPVPGVQRTPAASGPRWVAVRVQMKAGGGGGEGRGSTHFSAVTHPPRFSRPSSPLPSAVRGVGRRRSRSAHPQVSVAGLAVCESDTVSAARHLRSVGGQGAALGLGRGEVG